MSNETKNEVVNPLAARGAAPLVPVGQLPAAAAAHKLKAMEDYGLSGDFTDRDLKLPRINVVQSVGPLSAEWTPGQILLQQEVVLAQAVKTEPSPELEFTIINIRKSYEEILPYEEMEAAKRFETEQEVLDAGFRLQGWTDETGKKHKPTARPVARLLVLVKQPKGVAEDLFGTIVAKEDGVNDEEVGNYTVAMYTAKSTSYGMARTIVTRATALASQKPPLHAAFQRFQYSIKREEVGDQGNLVFVPKLRTAGLHSSKFVELILSQFKGL
jgi:hypothetical protein